MQRKGNLFWCLDTKYGGCNKKCPFNMFILNCIFRKKRARAEAKPLILLFFSVDYLIRMPTRHP